MVGLLAYIESRCRDFDTAVAAAFRKALGVAGAPVRGAPYALRGEDAAYDGAPALMRQRHGVRGL